MGAGPHHRRSAAAAATAAIALAVVLALAPAALAKLRPVGALRASRVTVSSVTIAWKDRSKGERAYEITPGPQGDIKGSFVIPANSHRFVLGGLAAGTVVDFSVAPCRRRGSACAPVRKGKPTATLLAPFGGPHPALGCEVFPPGDSLNERVEGLPVAPRSHGIIDSILGGEQVNLHPDFGSNPHYGIPYVVVPHDQPGARIRYTAYGDESDKGLYPIPPGAPVEGGSRSDGDRHVLVIRRPATPGGACTGFELARAFDRGAKGWSADAGAIFDFGSPLVGQRPAGWTSADAAGLPIFPGLVTKEEADSGEIDHAIRVTFDATRRAYYPPASHWASDACNVNLPAMGERLRLKAGYDLSGMTGDAKVIATALKRYGMIVADNGSDFYITGSTDSRWNDSNLDQLKSIPGSAFEVVRPDGPAVTDC